jgi:isopenicillin-N epimerase
MAIAPLPVEVDLTVLKARLYDEYRIEVPLIEWNGRKFVRISIQAYNTPEDVDVLLSALGALLGETRVMARL